MDKFTIGIDVGGTFTDLLLINLTTKEQIIEKTSSTPTDPSIGVTNGLDNLAKKLRITTQELLGNTSLIVHGTTVTTNAVLTSNGAKTGLLTTKGFRDVLQMKRGVRSRQHLYNNKYMAPEPLVTRDLVVGIDERTNAEGRIIKDIDEKEILEALNWFKEEGVESIAICYMHSYANPENEIKTKRIVEQYMPEAYVTVSTDVSSIIRLYNRVSTSAMNAYVGPILKAYMDQLMAKLESKGFTNGELLIMQSNGGVTNPVTVSKLPATTVLSGPAAGPVSGSAFARASGFDKAIVIDMGGTSFEASIIENGEVNIRREGEINRNLISLPMVSIHTIGSGGGSIAWIDSGGLLQVGPQSAGASPGPACYGRGGELPTCSDANLLLGYLNPGYFLGGDMSLDASLAEAAVKDYIAGALNMSVEEAAFGIYQISNLNMANGVKEVTIQNGQDPRNFPLVVAGGAGPIHAAMIARELDISEIIIPTFSSVLCAVGMLASQLRHDYVKSFHRTWGKADFADILEILADDKVQGTKALISEGVSENQQIVKVGLDMRYVGQHYEVAIEVDEDIVLQNDRELVENEFHKEHEKLYGFDLRGHEIEVINIRLSCRGDFVQFSPRTIESMNPEEKLNVKHYRKMFDPVQKLMVEVPVYDGDHMKAGAEIAGPAIVELTTTTIIVPSEFEMELDVNGNFIMIDTASSMKGFHLQFASTNNN
ncbi:hydantoinase/oxoprolinase family protein [Bacillus sp. V3B]|uniref:hydantoinase/oxoprolinase family protein n=1 Tax=Bacillus sp. V3B TaxID=2804915 RepID=UPI00210B64C5|nr:hydantoinase/oxoprolinase family protein [Bacillus sp. V3B]MCQ6277068.1 hydantoinase/oxoprolinase family protein [Bacillus sp. V3B]